MNFFIFKLFIVENILDIDTLHTHIKPSKIFNKLEQIKRYQRFQMLPVNVTSKHFAGNALFAQIY